MLFCPGFILYVLPKELLDYFEITQTEELCDISSKKVFISIKLEEKNHLPSSYQSSEYESKGFLSSKTVQDFPLRGKGLFDNKTS